MKKSIISLALTIITAMSLPAQGEEKMQNILENIPYREEGMGRRKLVDEDYLLMMQVALKPGDKVPDHQADSNVHILVLEGEVVVQLEGDDTAAPKGSLVPVKKGTAMHIRNDGESNATFVIMKTPHPATLQEK